MNKFLQLIVLVALAFYNAIQTVTGGATLKRLAPSGVIDQGILGGFSGKVGPVVGGKWKDIDYMRGYVVPANPNTAAQQVVRTKFSKLVSQARALLSTLLQPYWDPFYSNMSGFNAFISKNYAHSTTGGILEAGAIMASGTLTPVLDPAATYNNANGEVVVTWDKNLTGNALAADAVDVIAFSMDGDIAYSFPAEATRDDETATVTIPTGLSADQVLVGLVVYQGTGSELTVGNNSAVLCTEV